MFGIYWVIVGNMCVALELDGMVARIGCVGAVVYRLDESKSYDDTGPIPGPKWRRQSYHVLIHRRG